MRYNFLAASVAVALSGCKLGPDYQRPAVDMPPAFRFEVKDARDVANAEWWHAFGDPNLDGLVNAALSTSWTLQVAAAQVEQASAILTQTRAGLFPQIGYSGTAQRSQFPRRAAIPIPVRNPQNLYEALFTSTWEIDLWGRIRRQAEAAEAGLVGAEEARRGVVLTLVSSVAVAYLQLRALDAELETSRQTLGVYSDGLTLFENQFKYGEVSQLNVEQARAQYEGAAATVPLYEQQIGQAEDALSVLIGHDPGPVPRGQRLDGMTLPAVPAGLPSQLLERRPDIAEAEQALIAANAQIGAAKALYFPQISLTGAFGWASEQLHSLFMGPAQVWTFAGQFAGPIFSGGAISGQVAEAEAVQKQALANYQQTIQTAFAEVSDALIGYQKGLEQLAAEERLVTALRKNVELAWLQYREGYESYLTVLVAQRDLYSAEISAIQVRANAYASLVDIYKALGGGWTVRASASAPQPAPQPAFAFP
jgi:multidrug efflux system outer membrane protein